MKQIPIYLGKFFRMFIYMDDWKVLPMAAIIAGLVAFVAGKNMFVSMEGCMMGSLAMTCICIWNGFFNSIQVVCRERDIIKREHRSGMHISSYICAHVIYQGFLCLLQTVITVFVCSRAGMVFPKEGLFTPYFMIDFSITIFLITIASDMLSLMISCIAKTTTAAMTIMPFMLIFELLFSGTVFKLEGNINKLNDLSVAKWGIQCICAQSKYNDLPMVTLWNQIFRYKDITITDIIPLAKLNTSVREKLILNELKDTQPLNEMIKHMSTDDIYNFNMKISSLNANPDYVLSANTVGNCWLALILTAFLAICIAIIALEFIDRDKR